MVPIFRVAVYRGLLGREMVDAWLGWHAASTRPLNHRRSRRLTHQSASYLHQPRTCGAAMGAQGKVQEAPDIHAVWASCARVTSNSLPSQIAALYTTQPNYYTHLYSHKLQLQKQEIKKNKEKRYTQMHTNYAQRKRKTT